jgi:hypothetical protein
VWWYFWCDLDQQYGTVKNDQFMNMLVLFEVHLWQKIIEIYCHLQIIIIIIIILFKWKWDFSCKFYWIFYVVFILLLGIIFIVLCEVGCEAEASSITYFSINVVVSSIWWWSNGITKTCFRKIKMNEHLKFRCCVCVV